jgi:hypothetical protein
MGVFINRLLLSPSAVGGESSTRAIRAHGTIVVRCPEVLTGEVPENQALRNDVCNVDVCDQLLRLYAHGRDTRFLEFVRGVRQYYPPLQQMRRSGMAAMAAIPRPPS